MESLRWIHLSDIHFRGNEEYETKRMRDTLIETLKKKSVERSMDMIFITGDLAFQGAGYDKELVDFINKIILELNVPIDNVFIVPGNHDLKRTQSRKFIVQGVRDNKGNFEEDTIQNLQKGFAHYYSFYEKVKKEENTNIYSIENRENVNILLMNTALTAGADDDDSNLVLDKKQFYTTIKELKDKEDCLNIVLGHHPIISFSRDCQETLINLFEDYNVDLYLCGHMHKGGYTYDLRGMRNIPTYQCGGGIVDDYATTTFVTGEVDIVSKVGTMTYYKWLQSEECWTKGGADGRRAVSGEIDIVLDRFNGNKEEVFVETEVNEDEFRRFVMNFHEQLNKSNLDSTNIDPKDVFDKFRNMKCNKSVEKQYHSFSRYFQVIDDIIGSSLLSQIEKESIPNIVISEYNRLVGTMSNGNEIIEGIVQSIFSEYSGSFQYSNTTLKTYFKILVFWSIYECDIFNDEL